MINRIIIVGPSGSGKSTLAKKLKDILDIPLYHLDNIWWKEDKTNISREEFDNKLSKIVEEDNWIIDGDYSRTYDMRFIRATTIIFLDYPLEVALKGVESRIGTKRSDIPFLEDEFEIEFREWIINWFNKSRPVLIDKLNNYKRNKEIIILHNYQETERYINAIRTKYRKI